MTTIVRGLPRVAMRTLRYSARNAVAGATSVALRAGLQLAIRLVTRRRMALPAKLRGSRDGNSAARNTASGRVTISATPTPASRPRPTSTIPSQRIRCTTAARGAPSARLMPISGVRLVTAYETTPYKPTIARAAISRLRDEPHARSSPATLAQAIGSTRIVTATISTAWVDVAGVLL